MKTDQEGAMLHVLVVVETTLLKEFLNCYLQHTFTVVTVLAGMRDNFVDVVLSIARVRDDFFLRKGLLSNTDTPLSQIDRLTLVVSNQIDEVVNLLRGVPDAEFLLLAS